MSQSALRGKGILQGFTAVFALFIVPITIDLSGVDLDDCSENVEQFGTSRSGAKQRRQPCNADREIWFLRYSQPIVVQIPIFVTNGLA